EGGPEPVQHGVQAEPRGTAGGDLLAAGEGKVVGVFAAATGGRAPGQEGDGRGRGAYRGARHGVGPPGELMVDLSVPDWRERSREGRALLPSLPDLDRARADRAVKIFNKLRLPDVPGTPPLAEAGGEWFREIVGALHGSVKPNTRERMIREVFL